MDDHVFDLLRCPECGAVLIQRAAGSSELPKKEIPAIGERAEAFICCAAEHCFPVVRGIPRFVPHQAYAESFGIEWNLFAKTQMDHADREDCAPAAQNQTVNYAGLIATKGRESEETFLQKTGLASHELRGKTVLDAGCGSGRYAAVTSRMGAQVFAVDLSMAVEACRQNLGHRSNVYVLQADLHHLPFAPDSFDIIFSIGVLHHTPDTRKAFLSLPRFLKPGGKLCVWVYERKPWTFGLIPPWYTMSDLYRRWTIHWSPRALLRLARFRARLHFLHKVPLFGRVFQRLFPGSVHPDFEWRVLDTFDWYSPKYQWKHEWEEVEDWFKEAGLIQITRHSFPVAVSGVKPLRQP